MILSRRHLLFCCFAICSSTSQIPTTIVNKITSTLTTTTSPTTTQIITVKSKYHFVHRFHDIPEYTVWPGATVNLDCEINTLYDKPHVTWLKDEAPIQSKIFRFFYANNMEEMFTLKFENILIEESGKYSCIVGNKNDNKIRRDFHIVVEERPSREIQIASLLPENPQLVQGESFVFTCVASGFADSPKHFRWDLLTPAQPDQEFWKSIDDNVYYKVKKLKQVRCAGNNSTLMLTKASKDLENAIISCIVSDKNGFDRKSAKLSVVDRPPDKSSRDNNRLKASGSGGPSPAVIAIIVIILIILILCAVLFFMRRFRTTEKRKRKHSYFYDKPPLDTSIS